MEAALLALCLFCCAAPVVRAGLPVVDSAAAPAARSAAALLTPFMAPQKATLVVTGGTRWTGAFLRELSADIPRVLDSNAFAMSTRHRHRTDPRLDLVLQATHRAHLFHTEDLETLLSAVRTRDPTRLVRTIFWADVASPRGEVLRQVSQTRPWLGDMQYALALTAPDGSTALYNLTCTTEITCSRGEMVITETDSWSPVAQRWRRGGRVFHEFCGPAWRQTKVPTVFMIGRKSLITTSVLELTKSVIHLAGQGADAAVVYFTDTHSMSTALTECALGAALTDLPLLVIGRSDETTKIVEMGRLHVGVIVPAGLGPSVRFLETVTVEFSAMLWCATGLATLCTVVFFRCARTRDVGGAVLQALAPLLGQPPPPPAPPRPMLAAWLLACVVLTAAYQGLLLGRLSSAVPRRDLGSLREVKDSGLRLLVLGQLSVSIALSDSPTNRTQFVTSEQVEATIDVIATARNCALVTYLDHYAIQALRRHNLPLKKLHLIPLRHSAVKVIGVSTRGSPLERPMVTALARIEAAGLRAHWRRAEHARENARYARKLALLQGPRPLTLFQLGEAFVVLWVGHAVGFAAFALEALWAWHAHKGKVLPDRSSHQGR
ncbi:Ionotropic receptor 197 [Frankliniella occidentalis]|nr:Ionotropic receptor 197 [Frankliniella occidentalis]